MKCAVLVDWLTFSVKTDNPDDVIRDWLGMDTALFESFSYGINGYLQSKRFSSIIVAYNGYENEFFSSVDMGVCVSMSGAGCRVFESFSALGFDGLFKKLFEGMVDSNAETGESLGLKKRKECLCNVSRVDVACDDKRAGKDSGQLDMDKILEKGFFHHDFNSRMQCVTIDAKKFGDEFRGKTLYVGASSSSFHIRFYDKVEEQKEKGITCAYNHWIRCEMVMRDENARGFVAQAVQAESIGKLAGQILNDKFRFIERDNNNISRCSVCDWWAAFVEEVESVVLWSRSVVQHSVERVENWIRSQVSSSMAMIVLTMGFSRLREIVLEGERRLKPKQEALVHDFNAHRAASLERLQAVGAVPV